MSSKTAVRFAYVLAFAVTLCSVVFVVVRRSSQVQAAPAKSSTNVDVPPVAAAPVAPGAAKTVKVAPAGSTVYVVAKGESLPGILHRFLANTTFMTGHELEAAVRAANPELKGIFPKPGTEIIIPNYAPMPWTEKPVVVPKDFEVRAVYLTHTMAGSANGLEIVKKWRAEGGNAVVFDIKDSDGSLGTPFNNPLAPKQNSFPIRNVAKFTRFVHAQGMHAIARIAIFRDEELVKAHPELAVQSRANNTAWKENGKLVWTDPSHKSVQEYNIALARYAAENGADEIQFDYVRFPAEGDQKDAKFSYEASNPNWQRKDVITNFLEKAHAALKPYNVLFSIDVFGVMAWQRNVDLAHTGQSIPEMARNCDVMSPMIYPSHFYGMDGIKEPGDAPEHFISESMERFQKSTVGSGVVLRPWLQAFGWRTKTYSPEYIRIQVAASKSHYGNGFLFWNARNDYAKPYAAMPEMKAAKDVKEKFFRGDEVKDFAGKSTPAISVPAPAATPTTTAATAPSGSPTP
jgi:hypothetical protein